MKMNQELEMTEENNQARQKEIVRKMMEKLEQK